MIKNELEQKFSIPLTPAIIIAVTTLAIALIVVYLSKQTQSSEILSEEKTFTDGSVLKRDGTIIIQNGTIVKPDGTIVEPDGSIIQLDGTLIKPDGTIIKNVSEETEDDLEY